MLKPTDFKDLNAEELYRSAVEDFALVVEEDDKTKKKVLLAAFVEGGVNWADYVLQHPEIAPEPVTPVITSDAPTHNAVVMEPVVVEPLQEAVVVRVKEDFNVATNEKYLLKMTRENPLFEVRGHRFTSEHPYALVAPDDAQYILENEDGFRQAFPNELEEFYG